jgi:hypothetical protein
VLHRQRCRRSCGRGESLDAFYFGGNGFSEDEKDDIEIESI